MQEYTFDTVIVGTGCAGYELRGLAVHTRPQGSAIVTRGRLSGASRNTGSDKQTYYKLSLASGMPDSVRKMARDLCAGGGVNAGVALAEAAGSTRSFMKLVNLGVPFPCNEYGEFVGYQTDHDHSGRATSAGPYTSKYMTEALERAVLEKGIPILEGLTAFHLFTLHGRVTGLACIDEAGESEAAGLVIFHCNQLVIATGGEAAAYWDSVYPESQTGALGMLVRAGVRLVNLNHWQYGLASTKFRWNVSGSYQQALPRYVSVGADGFEHEFLTEAFPNPAEMLGRIFLKGYQWPFDAQKAEGSSKIDLLVQQECAKGRRVFLDFRRNPSGMGSGFGLIPEEAKKYLEHSGALLLTPYQRLQKLNPPRLGYTGSTALISPTKCWRSPFVPSTKTAEPMWMLTGKPALPASMPWVRRRAPSVHTAPAAQRSTARRLALCAPQSISRAPAGAIHRLQLRRMNWSACNTICAAINAHRGSPTHSSGKSFSRP